MATPRLLDRDKRYLSILEVGGPRKPHILRHVFPTTDRAFKASMRRLKAARLVVMKKRYGGPHVALARRLGGH